MNQIALSVVDLEVTEAWFRDGFGFVPAGGTRLLMSLPFSGDVQGLRNARSTCWFMIAENPRFQLELFQYSRPLGARLPADFRPNDTGYTRIGVWVRDFDATLRALAQLGSSAVLAPKRDQGHRRACVRSPDGVFVEIMEDDPIGEAAAKEPGVGPTVRSITVSTPDIAATVAYFAGLTGRLPVDIDLHRDADEAMWDLSGASCRRIVFRCKDILLEIVSYSDPAGRNWPDGYRICDIGVLNIAFSLPNRQDHADALARALELGAVPNRRPLQLGVSGVVYLNDALGFSVELMWAKPSVDFGYVAQGVPGHAQPFNRIATEKMTLPVRRELVWDLLTAGGRLDEMVRQFSGVHGAADTTDIYSVAGCDNEIRYRSPRGRLVGYHIGSIEVYGNGDGCRVIWRLRYRNRLAARVLTDRRRLRRLLRRHLGGLGGKQAAAL